MSLREKINQQFNAALKNKEKTLVSTLRLIMAAIKDKDIANRAGEKREAAKDEEIIKSMKFAAEHLKLFLEPACVAGIAALLGPLKNKLQNENTLIILCGSNIDMKSWIKFTENL